MFKLVVEELDTVLEMSTLTRPYHINVQAPLANWRRIGSIICRFREDTNFPIEDTIIAIRNQWCCCGDSTKMNGKRFIFSFNIKKDYEIALLKQPWIILGQLMIIHEVIENNFVVDPKLNDVPFWVTFSSLLVEYLS